LEIDTGNTVSGVNSWNERIHTPWNAGTFGKKRQEVGLVMWEVLYTRHAQKDSKKVMESGLKDKVIALILILEADPFQNPPPYEKLIGDLSGAYSRRINIQHRLVYQVLEDKKIVRILRMWTHYE
jgi:toxin YoeB